MVGWLVIAACVGLLLGAGRLIGRVGREWAVAIEQCRDALGGELTPGNLLLPPRLWRRSDDGLSLVIGLNTSGEGGGRMATRTLGARSLLASTRLTVDGDGVPGDIRIRSRGAAADAVAIAGRRVSSGIADFDRRIDLEGGISSVLSRLGADRRAAISAAVAQGAQLSHGMWVIERAEPITRPSQLIGLARLLLAAAEATRADGTIAEERLLDSVCRDPEPGFRLACLECLLTRRGLWRSRAIEAGLADPEPDVRLRAAQVAGVRGRETLMALAQQGPDDVRIGAIEALADDDGPEVRALFEALALGPHAPARAAALAGMARVGHAPVELLLRFARHPDPGLRVLALKALRPVRGVVIEQALAALDDSAPSVVLAAVEILGSRADASVVARLKSVRVGPLDGALKSAVQRACAAIENRPVPAAVGGLALAGCDQPEAGRLALDEDARGRLSDDPSQAVPDLLATPDLFAEPGPTRSTEEGMSAPPVDLFADEAGGAPDVETRPGVAGPRPEATDLFDEPDPSATPRPEVSPRNETE